MKPLLYASLLAAGAVGLLPATASAGDVVAEASKDFKHVQIATCEAYNPYRCPLVYDGPMSAHDKFKSTTGRLCYRRENRRGDADSGLTSWSCRENMISSPRTIDIVLETPRPLSGRG